jgi:hypothetical protein
MAVEVGLVDGTTCRDHAERLRDLDDAAILVARDDADGLHRPDEAVHLLRREEVLLDLVVDDAVAGFFDGKPGEQLGRRVAAAAIASTMASIFSG